MGSEPIITPKQILKKQIMDKLVKSYIWVSNIIWCCQQLIRKQHGPTALHEPIDPVKKTRDV